jgi:hypothetical protein
MGPRQSRPSGTATSLEVRGETNLKLKAQKIKDFTGGHKDWPKWKSQTKCAFSGSGKKRIVEDSEYAMANERLNKGRILAAGCCDGRRSCIPPCFEGGGNQRWTRCLVESCGVVQRGHDLEQNRGKPTKQTGQPQAQHGSLREQVH